MTHNYNTTNASNTSSVSKMSSTPNNIILNQNGTPCYNNIHIYTTGINGKNTELNLRQFVLNKINLPTKKVLKNNSGSNQYNKTVIKGKGNVSVDQ